MCQDYLSLELHERLVNCVVLLATNSLTVIEICLAAQHLWG